MKIIVRVVVLLYVVSVLFVCGFFILVIIGSFDLEFAEGIFGIISSDSDFRVAACIFTLLLMVESLLFARFFIKDIQDENKSVVFDNPSGKVSISMGTLEDLVKRTIIRFPEVKDVRCFVRLYKKRLFVRVSLSVRADTDIPRVTSEIQEAVKERIQNAIGLDDAAEVSIYIKKILHERLPSTRASSAGDITVEKSAETNIPFQGYRP